MRILITGYDGYIGSVMVKVLQGAGHEILGLDTGYFSWASLGPSLTSQIPAIHKDIRDVTQADLKGTDAIVHLAALCNDPLGDLNPEWTYDINLDASVRLARLAKDSGIQWFLFSSSCSIYGSSGKDELMDENSPLTPLTPYAISKIRTEEELSKLASADFSPVLLRNATAYGVSPRFRADIVLNNLVCWAFTSGKVRIMSDGTSWRPIAHIEDISLAFAAVLASERTIVHNQAYNVGINGENYQVRDIAKIVHEVVPGCQVEYASKGNADPRNYRVDFSKFTKALPHFKPKWDARKGAIELLTTFQKEKLNYDDFQGRKFIRLNHLKYLIESHALDETLRWTSSKV